MDGLVQPQGIPRVPAGTAEAGLLLGLPAGYALALLLALLVLVLAAITLAGQRRREREQRDHLAQLREREQRLRMALWASNELYWQYDVQTGDFERVQVTADPGPDAELREHSSSENIIHPDDIPGVLDRLRAHLRGAAPMLLSEHRIRGDDGHWKWMRARGRAIDRDANGRVRRIAGTARNINASRQMQRDRRIAAEVMRCMAEAVVVLDAAGHVVSVNPAFTAMTGFAAADAVGNDLLALTASPQSQGLADLLQRPAGQNGAVACESWLRQKNGNDVLCAIHSARIEEPGTDRQLQVLVLTDVTDRRRIEEELRYLANFDPLTNLPNRALLAERLSRAIVQARRDATRVAVLFLDVDNFKDINDSLGHPTGDRILRATAQRLQAVVGKGRTVARAGGDEFAVIVCGIGSAEAAEECAGDIIRAFDQPLKLDGGYEFNMSLSIGISLFPDHALVPTDLLKHADTAMYQAKAAGRHGYVHYMSAMDSDIRRRASLVTALRRVEERGELRLVFQPKLVLADGSFCGVEALLRWNSPEFGNVPPDLFIPLAEESGAILPIGEWVIDEACRTMAAWRAAGLGPGVTVCVNVSAIQLLRSDLPATAERALREHGLPASALEIELTESVLMAGTAVVTQRLQEFRELGIAIAVDDFGTGYSSLAYLHRLPITSLKIDKSFVDDMTGEGPRDGRTITLAIISLAHSLGLRVIAEGVETADQLALLKRFDCDVAQGYLIAHPLPPDECLAMLRAGPARPISARAAAELDPASPPA